MIIVDFDDTLFDTTHTENSFKNNRLNLLSKLGVSKNIYEETYLKARNAINDQAVYSNARHAFELAKHGFKEDQVLKILDSTTASEALKKFLFPEVKNFLEDLNKLDKTLILLSLGNPEFQYLKVKSCDIEKYFDRVFMTKDNKKHVVEKLLEKLGDENVWFINDKIEETLEVFEKFPNIKVVFKTSSAFKIEDYKKTGLPYFESLSQIKDYVESKI